MYINARPGKGRERQREEQGERGRERQTEREKERERETERERFRERTRARETERTHPGTRDDSPQWHTQAGEPPSNSACSQYAVLLSYVWRGSDACVRVHSQTKPGASVRAQEPYQCCTHVVQTAYGRQPSWMHHHLPLAPLPYPTRMHLGWRFMSAAYSASSSLERGTIFNDPR